MAGQATKGMGAEEWWAVVKPCLEKVRRLGATGRYQATCPLCSGTGRSLSVDLRKANGVWYCHGACQWGGSLRALALELGWVEFEHGPARVERLSEPYEFLRLEPDVPFDVRVVRWETGLSRRPIDQPPGFRTLETIRFHLPPEDKPQGPPYHDLTNLTLIIRVQDIYASLIKRADDLARPRRLTPMDHLTVQALSEENRRLKEINSLLKKISPSTDVPLTLRLVRHGSGRDTRYDAQALDA